MPDSIGTLPVVPLDYTNHGSGLHIGLTQLEGMLAAARTGHVVLNVIVTGAEIPVVLARSDLYLMGFQCAGNWFRFNDADWPFSDAVTKLGFDGQYGSLGGLKGDLTVGAIDGMARLANISHRSQWKESLRTMLVAVSECARLIPVRMRITGLLNGIVPTVPLAPLAHYIQNWDKASKGMDMSQKVAPNLSVGFSDPTIIRR